ncbi:hypothetical protein ACFR99_17145 [Haloarchaeobius amylolyticus]|uniref:Uncharacterized protein n=1 Tax=Haloarchaeobius amylolyticus TaxID=1198296 RepID=A0ABD6BKN0_9EURY
MKRRSVLAAIGTALTVFSAGCSSRIASDRERNYEFGIHNGSRDPYSFRIRIGNDLDGYFQEETFEMEGETANENVPVEDTPSRIYLKIDSAEERRFPWPASTSELGKIALKADIWYEPTLQQDILIQEG